MASRDHPDQTRRPAPRLYLLTPPVDSPTGLARPLAAAMGAADVAAVLVALTGSNEREQINAAKEIAALVQGKDAAFILDGHPDIVARAGADGAHLRGIDAFQSARDTLKPDRIAGCGALASRHDAMVAAEGGADYVMFGEPDMNNRRPSFEAILERIAWWAEVFEVPCVGYAADPNEIAPLAQAGADFIAVGEFVFSDPRGPAVAIRAAADQLMLVETAG